MELHNSCDSDVELGKKQGQGHKLLCVTRDIAALVTSHELKCRFIWQRNSSIAWYTHVFLFPRACPLCGTRHLRQRYMTKSSRFSLGDVGEARWPLPYRWTGTSPILPDEAHDSRKQFRVVSLSVLSLPSACVRLRQLREVHHSLQQALNAWSRTQSAATDGSHACCTSSLMSHVCVMLRVLPSQSSVRSLLVLLLYKQRCLSCLVRPV